MDTHTAITLLTIAVILLSIVIVAVLVLAIILLFMASKLVKNIKHITGNVAAATEWLTPAKLFGEAFKILRKKS